MAKVGSKTTVAYLTSEETRYGALPALLRQLADELGSVPEIVHDAVTIVPRSSSTNWGIVTDEWTVTVKGRRQNHRLPAGVAGPCPVCKGNGNSYVHGNDKGEALDRWNEDYEQWECIRCNGTGYLTSEAA